MSDEVDRAQEIQLAAQEDAIRKHHAAAGKIVQSDYCIDCDCQIPLARRAVVVCERCVDCQELFEKTKTR